MLASGIPPNQLCYGATLVACVRSGLWSEVESLLKEMDEIGLPLQESVLGSAINACRYYNPPKYGVNSNPFIGYEAASITPSPEESTESNELFQKFKAEWELIEQSQRKTSTKSTELWGKAVWLLENWACKVANCSDSLYTMTMDVLEAQYQYERVIYVYFLMRKANITTTKSAMNFAMRAASHLLDSNLALSILADARSLGFDTSQMYNITMVLCDKQGRHSDAVKVLLDMIYLNRQHNLPVEENQRTHSSVSLSLLSTSSPSSFRSRLPSVWITRRVISNALDALTKNFSMLFTEVVDGKLSPSEAIKPFVRDLTLVLRYTVYDKNLYLSATSYPMANKLLLDGGDYDTLRGIYFDGI